MNKFFVFFCLLVFSNFCFAEDITVNESVLKENNDFIVIAENTELSTNLENNILESNNKESTETELKEVSLEINTNTTELNIIDYLDENYEFIPVEIPLPKEPKPLDEQKALKAKNKDESEETFSQTVDVIMYGTPSEIIEKIETIVKEEDPRYAPSFYKLFQSSKNNDIKIKILEYFGKEEDPCLEDFAITILNDPYEYPLKLVEQVFIYTGKIKCNNASPAVVEILEVGNEEYFNGAISCLGKIGGTSEALYLSNYIDRDDLTLPQRQTLMQTLGQMCIVDTWDKLVEIVQDEDENAFIRMYAAESIGKMKKTESIEILAKLFEEGDPNMRQYCIKGLLNYPENKIAKDIIIQGIRDEHYKVRLEAIKAVKEIQIDEATPFLIYRATKDTENVVKKECYPVLASLNNKESIDFLIKQITDKKTADSVKLQACSALMEKGTKGEKEILELAKETLKDDKRKNLKNELGKLFIKFAKPGFAEICSLYLQSEDSVTVSQGIELYKNGRYEMARSSLELIAKDKKSGANGKRARKILNIPEEDNETKEDKDKLQKPKKESSTEVKSVDAK